MKKAFMMSILFIFVSGISGSVVASEWGCKCILCLSNPGGAKQFSECRPPINRLERHLEDGGSFPRCSHAESAGIRVEEGYERFYSCEEVYGSSWKMATQVNDYGRITGYYCRRIKGYRTGGACPGDEGNWCNDLKVPIYETRFVKRRSKPFYIQLISKDGSATFDRIWYHR